MEYPAEFNFRTNALFKPAEDYHLNACVGDNGGPYDLAAYGRGFFEGATAIVEAVKSGNMLVDVLVYPAAFSYRHGIELYLKHFYRLTGDILGVEIEFPKHHSVFDLWRNVRARFEKIKKLKNFDCVPRAEELIGAFCEIDPTGQVFRYPEDIKGNQHLAELSIINMRVLGDGMNELHQYLIDWLHSLEAHIEIRDEAKAMR